VAKLKLQVVRKPASILEILQQPRVIPAAPGPPIAAAIQLRGRRGGSPRKWQVHGVQKRGRTLLLARGRLAFNLPPLPTPPTQDTIFDRIISFKVYVEQTIGLTSHNKFTETNHQHRQMLRLQIPVWNAILFRS
jgi:hypothetical protein